MRRQGSHCAQIAALCAQCAVSTDRLLHCLHCRCAFHAGEESFDQSHKSFVALVMWQVETDRKKKEGLVRTLLSDSRGRKSKRKAVKRYQISPLSTSAQQLSSALTPPTPMMAKSAARGVAAAAATAKAKSAARAAAATAATTKAVARARSGARVVSGRS